MSGSDEDDDVEGGKQKRKTPTSTRLSDMAGRRPGSASPSSSLEQSKGASSQSGTAPAVYYSSESSS